MRTREEYAVRKSTTKTTVNEHGWEDPLLEALRAELREAIESTVQQELNQALGAEWYNRVCQRLGYRHGAVKRRLGVNRTPNFPPIRTLIFPPSVVLVLPSFVSAF